MKSKKSKPAAAEEITLPASVYPSINTWWVRNCNRKRYFLRQLHEFCGQPYVWIYEEGVNRCLHIPMVTLQKNYRQLHVGPVDPATGNALHHRN
jgi:hypothetical protein